MPDRRVGVIATVGPDPGLTDGERMLRARTKRWTSVLDGSRLKLARIECMLLTADESKRARLGVKAEQLRQQIAKAEAELAMN